MALDEPTLSSGFIDWFDRGTANEFEFDVLKSATAIVEHIHKYATAVEITLTVVGANPALATTTGPTDAGWGPPTLAPAAEPSPTVINALIATLAVAFDQGDTGWEYFATGQSSVAEVTSDYFSLTDSPDEIFRRYLVELESEIDPSVILDEALLAEGGVRDFSIEVKQPDIAVVTLHSGNSALEVDISPGYGAYLAAYSTWGMLPDYAGEAAPEFGVGTTVTDVSRDIKPLEGIILYQDLDDVHNNETVKQTSADLHAKAIHTATTSTKIPAGVFTNVGPYISSNVDIPLE
jgi:hypothetical protein